MRSRPASIAACELLPLSDDQVEQCLAIVLAHEPDADPAQLLEFVSRVRIGQSFGGQVTCCAQYRFPRRRVRNSREGNLRATTECYFCRLVDRHDDDVVGNGARVADAFEERRIHEQHRGARWSRFAPRAARPPAAMMQRSCPPRCRAHGTARTRECGRDPQCPRPFGDDRRTERASSAPRWSRLSRISAR